MNQISKEDFMQNINEVLNSASAGEEAYTIECDRGKAVIISETGWATLVGWAGMLERRA